MLDLHTETKLAGENIRDFNIEQERQFYIEKKNENERLLKFFMILKIYFNSDVLECIKAIY